jgi:hypothetical protein
MSKSTIRSIPTHHRQYPTEIIVFKVKFQGQDLGLNLKAKF